MVAGHDDFDDNSQGILRKDLPPHPEQTRSGRAKVHRQPYQPVTPGLPDEHYTVLRESRARRQAELERRAYLEQFSTANLHLHPVPNITPDYGPTHDGKREYTLQQRQDFVHGGFHRTRAVLGVDGGGVVTREYVCQTPLSNRSQRGLEIKKTISEMNFAFDEMIEMACCALDAHGVSWYDACRLIEQNMQRLQEQTPPEGA